MSLLTRKGTNPESAPFPELVIDEGLAMVMPATTPAGQFPPIPDNIFENDGALIMPQTLRRNVYKILKVKTLDSEAPNSLTQAEIAAVGNPLSVEELNEDELRRLVLVNLARLTCKQEWAGLL